MVREWRYMEKGFFQKNVADQLLDRLQKGDVPIERLRVIAQRALDLCAEAHIPNDQVLKFLEEHPEVEGKLSLIIEQEEQDERDETIKQIRELLDQHTKRYES